MRVLGIAENISASGKLIVRCSGRVHLRIGQKVFLNGKAVGKVHDVVGPVSRPWVLVDVGANPQALVGKELCVR